MKEVYQVLAAAMGQVARLDHIANNLANVSTIGFKQDRAIFDDLMKVALQGLDSSERGGAGGSTIPAYTHGYTDFSAGSMIPTGSAFDLFAHLAARGAGQYAIRREIRF